ncbi:hypothetical protein Tco_0092336, partial [Tanacetum coccineum]
MALPPHEQRHRFLRYEGLEYSNSDIADFESRMTMEHRDEAGVVVFTSQAWGRLFGGARRRLSWRHFILALRLHTREEMESPSFARFAAGRKSGAYIFGRQFMGRLAQHFRLLTAEILGGLTVIALELQNVDMTEFVRLQICNELICADALIVDEGGLVVPGPRSGTSTAHTPHTQLCQGPCIRGCQD